MKGPVLLARTDFEAALEALNTPLVSLALLDLDKFKEVNDTLGHAAGDEVLRSLERTLLGSVPQDALVGRISGDEYAVAFPGLSAENALILMEEVREHFSGHEISAQVPRKIGLSVGIAAKPPHAVSMIALMRAADDALYRAKREGRGTVAMYVEDKMVLKSNYYPRAALERLNKLSSATGRTEASLLREALEGVFERYAEKL